MNFGIFYIKKGELLFPRTVSFYLENNFFSHMHAFHLSAPLRQIVYLFFILFYTLQNVLKTSTLYENHLLPLATFQSKQLHVGSMPEPLSHDSFLLPLFKHRSQKITQLVPENLQAKRYSSERFFFFFTF
jgi:hypothetical protein